MKQRARGRADFRIKVTCPRSFWIWTVACKKPCRWGGTFPSFDLPEECPQCGEEFYWINRVAENPA